ncbi:MAG: DNA repair protein RadC [Bacteroidota bacterium]|nr:DNA repair protein RadC [Bacteroidota bacterium]
MVTEKDYLTKKIKTFKVHDLPKSERPRERLIAYGADRLSSAELISLILNTGIKGESVIMISQKIIMQFGSLKGIMESSLEDLKQVKGLGEVKATKLMASFAIAKKVMQEIKISEEEKDADRKKYNAVTSPDELYKIIKDKISNFSKEHFLVVSLDARNNFIGVDEISVGTLTASIVHPRETFESAIRRHAAHIIIAHNHPSGELEPSEDDLKITKRLVESGKIMGIEVLDHLIITKNSYLSFKEKLLI